MAAILLVALATTVLISERPASAQTSITGVAMTSDPGSDDRYVVRDTIEVTVTFSAAVTVTGTPRLTLNVGSPLWILIGRATRNADYKRRPEATKLVFGYTVAAGDNDTDGVSIVANALSLNGATISDTHGVVAQLVHNALPAQSGHLVDTTAPTVLDIFVDGAKLAIGYSETLDESSEPAANRFRVSVDGATRTVSDVAVTGKAVELTLSPAVHPGEAVQVRYTAPSTDPVRDLAGLAGGGFGYSDHEVTNLTRPTVSIAAADADIYEGTDADFILTRSGPTDSSLTAEVLIVDGGDVTDSETGRRTVDVEFRAGHSTASLAVATLDDRDYEAHARVSATVTPSSGYTVSSSAGSATVTVSDNDVPATDIVLAAPATIQEEAGMLTVRMRATTVRDEVPHGAVSVRLTSADGTAVSGENGDFTAVDVAVRLAIDDFARVAVDGEERHVYVATAERQIVIHDDSVSEPEETLTLRLRRSSGLPSRVTLPEQPTGVSIIDDEAPDRPINVTVSPGNTELTASWSPATGATGYRVQWKSGATETFGTAPADNRQLVVSGGDTTVAVIRNLMNGTAYTVRVIAFKPVRDGPPSEEATATPQTPPSRVTGVMASGRDGALAVSWSAPMRATGYKVQWKSGAAETFERAVADGREAVVSGNSSTRHTIADLRHCTPYTVRVIATNRGVDGPASAEVEGTPTFEPERARLGTVLVSNTGQSVDDAISVHIVASGSYTQEFTTGPGTGGFLLESVGIHIRSVVPPDTEPQFAHIHEVHRGGGLGARLYRLAPPNRLACNRVNLLKAPAYAPLEPDHRYLLAFPISPTDTIDIRVAATSSDAEDGGKASGWSIDNAVKLDSSPLPTGEALMISVNARRPTPPGAPARLVATAGDGGVTLAWTAPILDGGVPVIAYEYRYRKDSEANFPTGWNAVADSGDEGTETGNERSVTVAGLDKRGALPVPDAGGQPGRAWDCARGDGDSDRGLVQCAGPRGAPHEVDRYSDPGRDRGGRAGRGLRLLRLGRSALGQDLYGRVEQLHGRRGIPGRRRDKCEPDNLRPDLGARCGGQGSLAAACLRGFVRSVRVNGPRRAERLRLAVHDVDRLVDGDHAATAIDHGRQPDGKRGAGARGCAPGRRDSDGVHRHGDGRRRATARVGLFLAVVPGGRRDGNRNRGRDGRDLHAGPGRHRQEVEGATAVRGSAGRRGGAFQRGDGPGRRHHGADGRLHSAPVAGGFSDECGQPDVWRVTF